MPLSTTSTRRNRRPDIHRQYRRGRGEVAVLDGDQIGDSFHNSCDELGKIVLELEGGFQRAALQAAAKEEASQRDDSAVDKRNVRGMGLQGGDDGVCGTRGEELLRRQAGDAGGAGGADANDLAAEDLHGGVGAVAGHRKDDCVRELVVDNACGVAGATEPGGGGRSAAEREET